MTGGITSEGIIFPLEIQQLDEIKQKLLNFRDNYGQNFASQKKINEAKNIQDIEMIIELHRDFLESQSNEAQSHLDRFKSSLNIFNKF